MKTTNPEIFDDTPNAFQEQVEGFYKEAQWFGKLLPAVGVTGPFAQYQGLVAYLATNSEGACQVTISDGMHSLSLEDGMVQILDNDPVPIADFASLNERGPYASLVQRLTDEALPQLREMLRTNRADIEFAMFGQYKH